jgi:DNA-binding transcriptional regulator YbjK
MSEAALSPRMELLLRAALQVVAEHGLRGLTHRAVDRQAGLPEGSCSAYLRTRKALVLALTDYVAHQIRADVEDLAGDLATCALQDEQAIERVTTFFMGWLEQPELLVARMELTLESARDAQLATVLQGCRQGLVDLVEQILTARGKDHSDALAQTLVTSFDGVLLGALPRPVESRQPFVRQSIEVLIRGLG